MLEWRMLFEPRLAHSVLVRVPAWAADTRHKDAYPDIVKFIVFVMMTEISRCESCFLFLVDLSPMTHVGSRRMCLDRDVVLPLAGFRLYAVQGVFHHVLSVPCLLYAFFKLLTIIDLFIAPRTMFQASTTLQWLRTLLSCNYS
jgi:hypothetical protein